MQDSEFVRRAAAGDRRGEHERGSHRPRERCDHPASTWILDAGELPAALADEAIRRQLPRAYE
ncbi:MAG TPA: hypothetical protein VIA06_14460 [Candidatus Dormibacteraeota bacterium]|jgi:hypothetical protein|nr:hypothetical protein [Candidatus Dormibacteraeota bacterium]